MQVILRPLAGLLDCQIFPDRAEATLGLLGPSTPHPPAATRLLGRRLHRLKKKENSCNEAESIRRHQLC